LAHIARLYNGLIDGLRILAGVVVFGIFALIVADVLMRLVGLPLWIYASGAVEYGLLWFAMLGAPWLVRVKGHVFIDAATRLLPTRVQRVLAKIVYLICIASSATFAWYSGQLFLDAFVMDQIDTRGADMPLWTLLVPLPVCFTLVTIEFLRYLLGFDDMYAIEEPPEGM